MGSMEKASVLGADNECNRAIAALQGHTIIFSKIVLYHICIWPEQYITKTSPIAGAENNSQQYARGMVCKRGFQCCATSSRQNRGMKSFLWKQKTL